MKAAVCSRYGPPEMVEVVDAPSPEPAGDEVLVRVVSSTVNQTSSHIRAAKPMLGIRPAYGLLRPRRPILGTDFAGVVEQVGPDVLVLQVRDRVFGFDDKRMGGHGELLTMAASAAIAHIPDGVSFDDAAASVEGGHYALTYIERAALSRGSGALVYGGGGAIGSTAVQLLVSRGVRTTAVAEGHQMQLMGDLGADEAIDYQTQDFTAIGQDFDFVFDAVGKTRFGICKDLVRPGGIYMSTELGPWLENPRLAFTTRFRGNRHVHFPLPLNAREHVKTIRDELSAGSLRPVIDRTYPLDEIVEAYRYIDRGTKTGNVVLQVAVNNS
jgi:NADPH:quinone reductase-like Zn-dependent oxidoreductase